jgi:hypothetical protein
MSTIKTVAGVALAMGTGAGVASATPIDREIVGRIDHLNPRGHLLEVNDQLYRYNPRLTGLDLRRGEEVRVFYREGHGHRVAYKIVPAQA